MPKVERDSWSGHVAFVLAAAASAVGLGNLWRFPYLAAKYGGGVFIAVYLALSLTVGVALLVTEIAIGRYSRQSQLTAFSALGHRRWNALGAATAIAPLFILPYYNVIGGWVLRYLADYARVFAGAAPGADADGFFGAFISAPWAPFACMVVFTAASSAIVVCGVRNGIERANMVLMPALLAITVALAAYVATRPGSGAGIRYYLVPDFASCGNLAKTVLAAMGQMFYSLSLAMGVMITYGSYMRRCDSIQKASVRIVAADTFMAFLSGLMIIPVVVTFAAADGGGRPAIDAGPGLMFVTLPKVFAALGPVGPWLGFAFFSLVLFAALTSAISITEACVASVCDFFRVRRPASVAAVLVLTLAVGSLSAFGYGRWASFKPFGLPALEFFDSSMNVLMPVIAALTCVFVGWALGPRRILAECRREAPKSSVGPVFAAGYVLMVRFVAPLLVLAILVSEVCRLFGLGGWSI